MNINHAILHVLDFVACEHTYAREEIDISDKTAKRYVSSHARKALGNLDNKHGQFAPDSMFAQALRDYFADESAFVGLSADIAKFFADEFQHILRARAHGRPLARCRAPGFRDLAPRRRSRNPSHQVPRHPERRRLNFERLLPVGFLEAG
ncbi:MAG: nucleoid-associated protein [Coriobacteriaceae bacterium]|nr:nucleoid-associated protein [Coriobacteriaceae bacterium]